MKRFRPTKSSRLTLAVGFATAVATTAATAAATPDSGPAGTATFDDVTITLVTHDSFPTEDTPLNAAIDEFGASRGIDVEILRAGDAGTMVTKAVLTAGNPEGDVLYGVDNTNLSRAVDGGVFEPYLATGTEVLAPELTELAPAADNGDPFVTPIDFGDVCVNYDGAFYDDEGIEPPTDLASLADPAFKGQLVVQNPASSSPGLAFLLATIAEFGDGWQDYWRKLVDNDVEVVDDWNGAYYERFSATSDGDKPLVVSYATSPPFEVIYADPPIDAPTSAALSDTCFRQVEFAGVLAGTEHPDAAKAVVDFLLSQPFQTTIALDLFVLPVNTDVVLPAEITDFSVFPDDSRSLDPAEIAAHREEWIERWTEIVLR